MKFLVYLVMFFLLLNGFATAQTLIRDSCKKAADKDPNIKYDFCVMSLEQDPVSRTATTLEGLLLASTNNAASKVTSLRGFVDNILKGKKYQIGMEIPLRDCLEVYSNANASLNEAIKRVKSHDYRTANVNLSAALDAPRTCETGFKETKKQSPLTKDNDVLFQKIVIPLAFSNMV